MKRSISVLATALALFTGCGPGADPAEEAVARDSFSIPDDWDCSKVAFEAGGFRTLGNDAFRLEPGAQTSGALKVYTPIDAAFSSIATYKTTGPFFNWTSSTPIRAIIASAGAGKTTIYDYRPGATSGFGVAASDSAGATFYPQSILFCFDAPPPVCSGGPI